MNQLLVAFNQHKSGTLLRDTVQNLRNNGACLAITTQSGRALPKLHYIIKSYIDDVVLEDGSLEKCGEWKSDPNQSKKLKEIGEIKATIRQTPDMRNEDKLRKKVRGSIRNATSQDS